MSERSRRASESAGQASLAYAAGPKSVPQAVNVQTDMPPVILDPSQPNGIASPSSGPLAAAAPSFSSVSGVKNAVRSSQPSLEGPKRKETIRMNGAPLAPTSQPRIETAASSSGPFEIAVTEGEVQSTASSSGPHVALPSGGGNKNRKYQRTIVVRSRRASPVEKAFAFAAALVLICTIGAAIFWYRGRERVDQTQKSPPAKTAAQVAPH
jgi:hypothetical protein